VYRNRLYYLLKPLIPWSVRLAIRRRLALRKLPHIRDVWPIQPGSEKPPAGWPGWPEGKQFAFVLTHDVEGPEGLAKVRPLAELEMKLGFRSCFNFIPEGPYRVPDDLRTWLVSNGFEIGVHDLHHDGKLFASRENFRRCVPRINRYLKEWDAAGFRAGFMLHNLDWLHELSIRYDASTFDTDPFEPQPQGQHTIFPFWVPATKSEIRNPKSEITNPYLAACTPGPAHQTSNRGANPADFGLRTSDSASPLSDVGCRMSDCPADRAGYVELPYTLPQDSTLFLLLGEKSPRLWIQKLDWIARHGGMALVNVHPDYLHFRASDATNRTVTTGYYEQVLRHVSGLYGGNFWMATPRRVAGYVAGLSVKPLLRPRLRVCMASYSFYETDQRVMRYAEALAERGDQVDVLVLRNTGNAPRSENVAGVWVHRIQTRMGKSEQTRLAYLAPLVLFLLRAGLWITRSHWRNRYQLLHVHNVPDFLVFAAGYPKATGARVILDIHDIVPELYASKFSLGQPASLNKGLLVVERWSARFADHVILANHLWQQKYATRTGAGGKCSVFLNHVDTSVFHPRPRTRQDHKPLVLFPGGLQWHQGLDIAIRAFQLVIARLPEAELHIYGDGPTRASLMTLARELGLNGSVKFHQPRPVREIAGVMADADLGVVPKRADSFGNEAYSTKIMEFMALGVPVVVSSTQVDRFYFDDSVVRFFASGNVEELATAIIEVLQNREDTRARVVRASAYARSNCWESRKHDYLKLVDNLCASVPLHSD